MRQIETSLDRLETDHLDLLQHHEILRFDDPDRIFGEDGAMEAFIEAKKAGKLRFIGFTGHKDPRVHLYMLEIAARYGFRFDTVQKPLNVMDAHFRSFVHRVLPRLVEARIGVLGMKTFGGADGIILKNKAIEPIDCLHYSLNLPTSVVITGIDDQKVLDQAFEAVKTFQPMSEEEIPAIVAKTQRVATDGKYELFKTFLPFRYDREASVTIVQRCKVSLHKMQGSGANRWSGTASKDDSARPLRFPQASKIN